MRDHSPTLTFLWRPCLGGRVYFATHALPPLFGFVRAVTGDGSRAQPISEGQFQTIRRLAGAHGVAVKAIEAYGEGKPEKWRELVQAYACGECELNTIERGWLAAERGRSGGSRTVR